MEFIYHLNDDCICEISKISPNIIYDVCLSNRRYKDFIYEIRQWNKWMKPKVISKFNNLRYFYCFPLRSSFSFITHLKHLKNINYGTYESFSPSLLTIFTNLQILNMYNYYENNKFEYFDFFNNLVEIEFFQYHNTNDITIDLTYFGKLQKLKFNLCKRIKLIDAHVNKKQILLHIYQSNVTTFDDIKSITHLYLDVFGVSHEQTKQRLYFPNLKYLVIRGSISDRLSDDSISKLSNVESLHYLYWHLTDETSNSLDNVEFIATFRLLTKLHASNLHLIDKNLTCLTSLHSLIKLNCNSIDIHYLKYYTRLTSLKVNDVVGKLCKYNMFPFSNLKVLHLNKYSCSFELNFDYLTELIELKIEFCHDNIFSESDERFEYLNNYFNDNLRKLNHLEKIILYPCPFVINIIGWKDIMIHLKVLKIQKIADTIDAENLRGLNNLKELVFEHSNIEIMDVSRMRRFPTFISTRYINVKTKAFDIDKKIKIIH